MFTENSVPDLTGRVIVITGGTAGLGLASAVAFYRKNATVIITARNQSRGEEALTEIKRQVPESKGSLEFGIMDQTSLLSVNSFVTWFLSKNLDLHVLLLNSGIAAVPHKLIHGIESQFFVNHLSHFYLLTLLENKLKSTDLSRIVFVSSDAHRLVRAKTIDWEQSSKTVYSGPTDGLYQYGVTKLANIHCCNYFARYFLDSKVLVNAIHPGVVSTNIASKVPFASTYIGRFFLGIVNLFAYSSENGALTQIYASVDPEIKDKNLTGKYFVPVAKLVAPTELALNEEAWDSLYSLSVKLVGQTIEFEKQ